MTAQEIHEDRLRRLHCCIAEKAVEMSDYMSLGSKKAKCKLEDLELLNAYYDILLCHVPYDCADVCGTDVCCNINTTPAVTELVEITAPSFHYGTLGDIQDAVSTDIEGQMNLGTSIDIVFRSDYFTSTTSSINIPYVTTNIEEIYDYIVDYINSRSTFFGYTISYNTADRPGWTRFIATTNDCERYQDNTIPMFWGFVLTYANGSPTNNSDGGVVNYSDCGEYETRTISSATMECIENCLSDEQYDAVWEWIASKCDCLGLERSDESLVIGDKAFEDGECFEFEDDYYYQFD